MNVTQKYLKEAVTYLPESGKFIWKTRPLSHFKSSRSCNAWNARFSGKSTGELDSGGHLQVKLGGKKYAAHRLAFLYVTGSVPEKVDHIDQDKKNNSFHNLRECTSSQNCANRFSKGVYPTKSGKWRSQICFDYKIKHLGTFPTEKKAKLAYMEAHKKYFKEYSPYFFVV